MLAVPHRPRRQVPIGKISEFFAAIIRNKNTREAYFRAISRFLWCADERHLDLEDIRPIHVAPTSRASPWGTLMALMFGILVLLSAICRSCGTVAFPERRAARMR